MKASPPCVRSEFQTDPQHQSSSWAFVLSTYVQTLSEAERDFCLVALLRPDVFDLPDFVEP